MLKILSCKKEILKNIYFFCLSQNNFSLHVLPLENKQNRKGTKGVFVMIQYKCFKHYK